MATRADTQSPALHSDIQTVDQEAGKFVPLQLPSKKSQVRPSTWASYRGYVEGQIIPRRGG